MFVPKKPFQPCLIIEGQVRGYPSEAPFRFSTFGYTHKYQTWLYRSVKDKHQLITDINYKTYFGFVMYRNWTDYKVSQCFCYCQSLSLSWRNTLAYYRFHTLRIYNGLWYRSQECFCYCQSLSLSWRNTLAYYRFQTLRICNVYQ